MIYLEIFELNFLNLSKNTKRNIKLRINDELIERSNSLLNCDFEAGDGYIFKNDENEQNEQNDNNNLKVELKQFQIQNNNDENNYEQN